MACKNSEVFVGYSEDTECLSSEPQKHTCQENWDVVEEDSGRALGLTLWS